MSKVRKFEIVTDKYKAAESAKGKISYSQNLK
jgi:hypothetical protein